MKEDKVIVKSANERNHEGGGGWGVGIKVVLSASNSGCILKVNCYISLRTSRIRKSTPSSYFIHFSPP